MLLSDLYSKDNNIIRRYYVGMTRAKNRLYIHTNGDLFNKTYADKFNIDSNAYSMPEEIVLQLSHKDVYLDFFKERKKEILSLRSGDSLNYKDTIFYNTTSNAPVAKLSKNMQTIIEDWHNKGYNIKSSYVRFVVAWKPKDAPKEESETAVALIDLMLTL